MVDVVESLGPWSWIILGPVLVGLELVAPGVFLIWLGLAAVLTGVLDVALGLSWQTAVLMFAVLAVGAVIVGWMVTRSRSEDEGGRPTLNRHGHTLVGRMFTLETPIVEGSGRIRVDDASWRVVGSDMPVGVRVRVVRIEGTTLVVEAV
jgi:inner membrane protein